MKKVIVVFPKNLAAPVEAELFGHSQLTNEKMHSPEDFMDPTEMSAAPFPASAKGPRDIIRASFKSARSDGRHCN